MVDVSILIPAYNEAENIAACLEKVQSVCDSLNEETEIIVIDDGSNDGTPETAGASGVRVISHSHNRGYGAALKTGLKHSAGDAIVILDADLTYPAERIPELLERLKGTSMAVGARTGDSVHIPTIRRPAKWVLGRLANLVAGQKIPDLNSGLRAFRKDLALKYMHLYPDGFSFTTTLTLAALCDGHEVAFIPIDYAARGGRSKVRPIKDTLNFLILIIRVAAYFEPLRVFLPATLFSGCISLLLIGYYMFKDGGLSDACVFACLITFLIFMMGILADLVVRRARQ